MTKTNIPTILVIFGATGDLMKKKLAPALFHLWEKKILPDRFRVIGFSRRDYADADFRKHVADNLKAHQDISYEASNNFLKLFTYARGDLTGRKDYKNLAKVLKSIDGSWGVCANKLFYLAVPPEFYKTIFSHLSSSGLTKPCSPEEGWTRVIVEKPFGKNAKTAEILDEVLGKLFREVQIYRIDHYLAKEMLQNILTFRFSNNLFEENWSGETIERIDIRLWEKLGVEDRGAFYDGVGALRDVGQNHLLQMLSLITMERPGELQADTIRRKRAEILKMLKVATAEEIKMFSTRAQYTGYQKIPGVAQGSETETYFKIKAELNSSRWNGVPITLESGKRLGTAQKEIVVTFRHPQPCLCPGREHYQNRVVFSLEPEERITIHFWSKKPGLSLDTEERTFDFLLRNGYQKGQYIEEYEKLLLDCITGDQTLFVSTDEVRAMWKFIDPFIKAWQKNLVPLQNYIPDTAEITKETLPPKPPHEELKKEIGYIGLGKMGKNMILRLLEKGWRVYAFDKNEVAIKDVESVGAVGTKALKELSQLSRPRLIWLMVPAGQPVDEVLFGKNGLSKQLEGGDSIIDGGNSFFKDSVRRAQKLKKLGIRFLDIGVSGGPSGARYGASLMIGGERKAYEKLHYLFRDLAIQGGYEYMGKSGAGHFVKMIHNGIEYGMMQAIAEGFTILKRAKYKLDLTGVTDIYNHGSVIESKLLKWLKKAFELHGENLKDVSGAVAHTGEGAWTVRTAKEMKIKTRIIEAALKFRIQSEKNPSYTGKILSALREQFGGHNIKK